MKDLANLAYKDFENLPKIFQFLLYFSIAIILLLIINNQSEVSYVSARISRQLFFASSGIIALVIIFIPTFVWFLAKENCRWFYIRFSKSELGQRYKIYISPQKVWYFVDTQEKKCYWIKSIQTVLDLELFHEHYRLLGEPKQYEYIDEPIFTRGRPFVGS